MNKHTGFVIPLAWPANMCRQAGAWYDGLMNVLGISKNHYYKVGHAALVLVNSETGQCFYFDFGRYHSPFHHGRVRSSETDHDLILYTKALIKDNKIVNFEQLVTELANNPACHGDGAIHASYCAVDFDKAFIKATEMEEKSPWKYGPFIWKGTNCSRFVRTVALAGQPNFWNKLKLSIPPTLTPSPVRNVKCLPNYLIKSPLTINH
jgi:hypothetical protein